MNEELKLDLRMIEANLAAQVADAIEASDFEAAASLRLIHEGQFRVMKSLGVSPWRDEERRLRLVPAASASTGCEYEIGGNKISESGLMRGALLRSAEVVNPIGDKTEREEVRARQAAAVMPLIGPLLDEWEAIPNDERDGEWEGVGRKLGAIAHLMENPPEVNRLYPQPPEEVQTALRRLKTSHARVWMRAEYGQSFVGGDVNTQHLGTVLRYVDSLCAHHADEEPWGGFCHRSTCHRVTKRSECPGDLKVCEGHQTNSGTEKR